MKIGFIGIRYPKGIGILLEDFARLAETLGHTAYFLSYPLSRRRPCLQEGDWRRDRITVVSTFQRNTVKVDDDTLRGWIKNNGLDLVFTIEEPNNLNVFSICKELGVPSINYVDIEKLNASLEQYKDCSLFFCPTQQCYDKLFEYGLRNVMYVGYVPNIQAYPYKLRQPTDKVEFVHHAGWGGVAGRKGTMPTIRAFAQAKVSDTLTVITQKRWKTYEPELHKIVSANPNIKIREVNDTLKVYNSDAYFLGHVVIQPSMWEGLGLTYLEAMVCGMPAIVTNAAPMNQFVKHEDTGLLVKCEIVDGKKIHESLPIPAAIVDEQDLTKAIIRLSENKNEVELFSHHTEKLRIKHGEYVENFKAMLSRV